MATNKNQHFVPRCYLRPFTVQAANAAINLFNIDRQKIVLNAAVRSQCSGDYFYGTDSKLERALQATEGAYATTLKSIQEPAYRLGDAHKVQLRRFWQLQYMRTDAASRRAVEMAEESDALLSGGSGAFRLGIKDAVQIAMLTYVDLSHVLDDLKVCLVKNRTAVPFVTSDNPAVMVNRWHQRSRRTNGMSCGLNAAGIVIYLPLSPRILCIGYDGDVYSVPHENSWTTADRESDIVALNEPQYLNCQANIFFQDGTHAAVVKESGDKAIPHRPKVRHIIHYAVLEKDDGETKTYREVDRTKSSGPEEAIIHWQSMNLTPATWPSQLNWRHNGCVYSNGTAVGFVRKAHTYMRGVRPFRKERALP